MEGFGEVDELGKVGELGRLGEVGKHGKVGERTRLRLLLREDSPFKAPEECRLSGPATLRTHASS